ncbi:hypothetical protein ACVWYN_000594 [Pedobacter sp. UYP24]
MKKIYLTLLFCSPFLHVFSQVGEIEHSSKRNVKTDMSLITKSIKWSIYEHIDTWKFSAIPKNAAFITSISISVGRTGLVDSVYFPNHIEQGMKTFYSTNRIAIGIRKMGAATFSQYKSKILVVPLLFMKSSDDVISKDYGLLNSFATLWPDFIIQDGKGIILIPPILLTTTAPIVN